ncbi:MAG TPA: DUF2267 domain-containing protein [Alteraurantiacibacter sp.]
MSATGLDVFDKTIQTTHVWLDEISERIGPDRQLAWKVLSTVLHKLRDRLQPDLAAHLGAQLPLLVRGAYYDLYEPSKQPLENTGGEEFVAEVSDWLSDARPVDPNDAIAAVFAVLDSHVSQGQLDKVRHALPRSIRVLWQVEEPSENG